MNIEAYNLDSLRRLIRNLQDENKRLKAQLNKANIAYESGPIFEEKIETAEEYDPDQGGRGGCIRHISSACRWHMPFLVFDFDNHEKGAESTDFANTDDEWHDEVDVLRLICERNGITPLVERSRSGRGAHVWIFSGNQ